LVTVFDHVTRQGHCTYEYANYGHFIRVPVPSEVTVGCMETYLMTWCVQVTELVVCGNVLLELQCTVGGGGYLQNRDRF
jgi:hypothetical protein